MKIKVKLTPKSKEILTLAEMPVVKEILNDFAENPYSLGEFELGVAARIAARQNGNFSYYDVQAEISKNARIWNAYNDNSRDLDIWITFKAFDPFTGFYEIGCYLTDIWQSTGENGAEIRGRMFIREYKEV